MSWHFAAVGRPSVVLKRAQEDLAQNTGSEPEEAIKLKFLDMLNAALSAMLDDIPVKVEAFGSQSTDPDPGKFTNTISINVAPVR